MKAIEDSDLLQLADTSGDVCVSLYMPTDPMPEQSQQNRDRFGKLIQSAEARLIQRGMSSDQARGVLHSASELSRDSFWETMSYGFGALLTEGSFQIWHLPDACDELCVVGKRFHILPLLQWATDRRRYYILALGRDHVRLLKGTYSILKEVTVLNVPAEVRSALSDDPSRRSGLGNGTMAHHVKGFLREVDHTVTQMLRVRQDPLVFAGPDNLFPIYQAVNTYAYLVHTHISCEPDSMPLADLRDRAIRFIDVLIRDRQQSAIEKYWELVPQAQTTSRLEDILVFGRFGRN